jgi:hypothetical protein
LKPWAFSQQNSVKYADGDIDFLIDIIDKIKKYHKSKKAIAKEMSEYTPV